MTPDEKVAAAMLLLVGLGVFLFLLMLPRLLTRLPNFTVSGPGGVGPNPAEGAGAKHRREGESVDDVDQSVVAEKSRQRSM